MTDAELDASSVDAHSDDLAVDRFAAAMKAKLAKKRDDGRGGWEGPTCSAAILSRQIHEHVEKGDPLDVGNLAMMLHQRAEKILPDVEWAYRQVARNPDGRPLVVALRAELARLRNLIAGLDPDHWGLQARVVALKEAALKKGGA